MPGGGIGGRAPDWLSPVAAAMLIFDLADMMRRYRQDTGLTLRLVIAATGMAVGTQVATTSNAQPATSVVVDVGACVDLESGQERLQCFEDRVAELERGANEPVTGVISRPPAEPAAVATEPERAPEIVVTELDPVAATPTESRQTDEPELSRSSRREARQSERRQRDRAEAAAAAANGEPNARESASEIVATITALREVEPNAYLITLDNGQVWRQNQPKRYFLLTGVEVELQSTRWGHSYRLRDPNVGSYISVERVR